MSERPMRYCLVTPAGDITFDSGTLHQIRALIIGDGAGETGLEFLNSMYPVAAYYYVPYDTDGRRMNKAANGMFWELNGPVQRDAEDDEPDGYAPDDRKIKMRGMVAFIDRHTWGLTPEAETRLRETHERVVDRLRHRGWL